MAQMQLLFPSIKEVGKIDKTPLSYRVVPPNIIVQLHVWQD